MCTERGGQLRVRAEGWADGRLVVSSGRDLKEGGLTSSTAAGASSPATIDFLFFLVFLSSSADIVSG